MIHSAILFERLAQDRMRDREREAEQRRAGIFALRVRRGTKRVRRQDEAPVATPPCAACAGPA